MVASVAGAFVSAIQIRLSALKMHPEHLVAADDVPSFFLQIRRHVIATEGIPAMNEKTENPLRRYKFLVLSDGRS